MATLPLPLPRGKGDVFLSYLPFAHIFDWQATLPLPPPLQPPPLLLPCGPAAGRLPQPPLSLPAPAGLPPGWCAVRLEGVLPSWVWAPAVGCFCEALNQFHAAATFGPLVPSAPIHPSMGGYPPTAASLITTAWLMPARLTPCPTQRQLGSCVGTEARQPRSLHTVSRSWEQAGGRHCRKLPQRPHANAPGTCCRAA